MGLRDLLEDSHVLVPETSSLPPSFESQLSMLFTETDPSLKISLKQPVSRLLLQVLTEQYNLLGFDRLEGRLTKLRREYG